jgi:two-component system, chemotaxis family, chemotaxis protein CheY
MTKTVLIIDDSTSLRGLVKMALSRAGYAVIEAADGNAGVTQLDRAEKVHLIVTDVNMPGMDGISFVQHIKQHPKHKFIPVMMLTTESEASKMQLAKAAGARAWLKKPFNPPELLDAVSRLASA